MTSYALRRTGEPRLKFDGEEIAHYETNEVGGRYRKYALYHTIDGIVLEMMDVTYWKNEFNSYAAIKLSDLEAVRSYLACRRDDYEAPGQTSEEEDELLDDAEQALDRLRVA